MTRADPAPLEAVLNTLEERLPAFEERVATLVGIPSVSTDPAHADDVRAAAETVAGWLREAGPLEVEIIATEGHPAVLATWDGAPEGAPTVLVYGHMDVQPPDPLEAWDSPPFELTHRDGLWYGRGVSDDKASMTIPICVAEAFFARGTPPVNLRFLLEAEEEVGSPNLPAVVRAHADRLACDVVLSADGGMWRADLPTITTRTRGLGGLQLTVHGPSKDLHSGRHGGAVANPLHALAELVAGLHDADGRVAVDGFYDGVTGPDEATLAALDALPFDEDGYRTSVGAPELFGESGYGTLARLWDRPTLEVNGVGGGYQGPGTKTVLPSHGFAKITCRLVAGQDPDRVVAAIRAHLEARVPPGVTVEVALERDGAVAYQIPHDHPVLTAAEAVLAEVFEQESVRVGMGGSIPITVAFRETLGAETLLFSFSVADENIHAPNEFYRPERFRAGLEAWARLWDRLAREAADVADATRR